MIPLKSIFRPQDAESSLWRYATIDNYHVPAALLGYALKERLVEVWKRLRAPHETSLTTLRDTVELQNISESLLDAVAPEPTWQTAATAFRAAFAPWFELAPKERPLIFVIGPPYNGNADTLFLLAQEQEQRVCTAPAPEQILDQDLTWLIQLEDDTTSWVIPALEQWYVRHVHGLTLLRQLFERYYSGKLQAGIIGCDSWAWAYLTYIFHGCMPQAYTTQAFDRNRLICWFRELAQKKNAGPDILFRHITNGKDAFATATDAVSRPNAHADAKDFFSYLESYSRGIPGIALAIWRQSLRSAPENAPVVQDANSPKIQHDTTIWILPWAQISLPQHPEPMKRIYTLVLHALLLHHGLAVPILTDILPYSSSEITQTLVTLQEMKLVEHHEDHWYVSAVGYPVVRQFLYDEGYLIDQF
ncbi:MAG: hypothetical protein RBT80_16870 [Candidatus Vecturithrix sp.]|nr:hypothetical protein [Candidatus Vecturithrix sp.]